MNIEIETSAIYSLPLDVARNGLFDGFCETALDVGERFEQCTYRRSRLGSVVWRLGKRKLVANNNDFWKPERSSAVTVSSTESSRDLARSNSRKRTIFGNPIELERRHHRTSNGENFTKFRKRTFDDRLDLLRCLSSDEFYDDVEYFSELKCLLVTSKKSKYIDSWSLTENLNYPMIFENSLALEIDTANSPLHENVLSHGEDDVSDNNLGLIFHNRFSTYVRDVTTERIVRWSVRAKLNEYHEISYQMEFECERESLLDNNNDDDDDNYEKNEEKETESRELAIINVCRAHAFPLLKKFWPDGLRFESPRFVPPREIFDDLSNISLLTGESVPDRTSRDILLDRVSRSIREKEEKRRRLIVKKKFDGKRCYATFSNGALWCDSSRVNLDARNEKLFSGLYVYQGEWCKKSGDTSDDDANNSSDGSKTRSRQEWTIVINEIVFAVDHRLVVSNGNSPLARHFEQTEYAPSYEQRETDSAYAIGRNVDLWPEILRIYESDDRAHVIVERYINRAVERVKRDRAIAMDGRLTFHAFARQLFGSRAMYDELSKIVRFYQNVARDCNSGKQYQLIPINIGDSNRVLADMAMEWRSSDDDRLSDDSVTTSDSLDVRLDRIADKPKKFRLSLDCEISRPITIDLLDRDSTTNPDETFRNFVARVDELTERYAGLPSDGWLIGSDSEYANTRRCNERVDYTSAFGTLDTYVKIKSRQTVEMSIADDLSHISTSDGVYAVRCPLLGRYYDDYDRRDSPSRYANSATRTNDDDDENKITGWKLTNFWARSNARENARGLDGAAASSSIDDDAATNRTRGCILWIHGLSLRGHTNHYRVAEFAYRDGESLRFLRYREDKAKPDSSRKVNAVLANDDRCRWLV